MSYSWMNGVTLKTRPTELSIKEKPQKKASEFIGCLKL